MNKLPRSNLFFAVFREKDEVSLEELYSVGKRDEQDEEKNKEWIGNKLNRWKKRGIAEPIYGTRGFRRVLRGAKVTQLGRTVLGRNASSHTDIMKVISKLKREYPQYEITFEIRLR